MVETPLRVDGEPLLARMTTQQRKRMRGRRTQVVRKDS